MKLHLQIMMYRWEKHIHNSPPLLTFYLPSLSLFTFPCFFHLSFFHFQHLFFSISLTTHLFSFSLLPNLFSLFLSSLFLFYLTHLSLFLPSLVFPSSSFSKPLSLLSFCPFLSFSSPFFLCVSHIGLSFLPSFSLSLIALMSLFLSFFNLSFLPFPLSPSSIHFSSPFFYLFPFSLHQFFLLLSFFLSSFPPSFCHILMFLYLQILSDPVCVWNIEALCVFIFNSAQGAVTSWMCVCLFVDSCRTFLGVCVCWQGECVASERWQRRCGAWRCMRPFRLRPCLCWGSKWLLSHVWALVVTSRRHCNFFNGNVQWQQSWNMAAAALSFPPVDSVVSLQTV